MFNSEIFRGISINVKHEWQKFTCGAAGERSGIVTAAAHVTAEARFDPWPGKIHMAGCGQKKKKKKGNGKCPFMLPWSKKQTMLKMRKDKKKGKKKTLRRGVKKKKKKKKKREWQMSILIAIIQYVILVLVNKIKLRRK